MAALLLPSAATAAPSDPSQWPDQPGTDPELVATSNTIRFAGADRYQTNQALNLALRGGGDYPFDTSDRTSGGAAKLAQAKQWWGARSCPRSIIVVAGDNVADALAAASLSDPNDRSTQPRLQRAAAADPVFDPPGGFARVDTAFAPIVATTSGRSGATGLAPTARATAADLSRGGCTLARQAIVVGGTAAVPTGAEAELIGLGYDEVFRVAGADRYDTAARMALALGTGGGVTPGAACGDPDASDGTAATAYHGNAVIEYRPEPSSCRLMGRTVVLADGVAGIDALAAGWWTSYWQVPVLLTGPAGGRPPATRAALESLDVDTIVVLGGEARIPKATKELAAQVTGAIVGTFDGTDRYATSVLMAQSFGGWYPGRSASFAGDLLCLTASAGATGSPDALAAGPFCGRLAAAGAAAPVRAEPPVEGAAAGTLSVGGLPAKHAMAPVLLAAPGGALPPVVATFLQQAFAATRCNGAAAPPGCAEPGFAVLIGGGVGATAVGELGELLADVPAQDRTPVADGFATRLDLRPVFPVTAATDVVRSCYGSDSVANVRWLSLTSDASRTSFLGQRDVLRDGWYVSGDSVPNCVVLPNVTSLAVTGVGPAGQSGRARTYDLQRAAALSVSRPFEQDGTASTAGPSTVWSFTDAPGAPVLLERAGISREVRSSVLGLNLTSRVGAPGVAVAAGNVTLTTDFGQVSGTVRADARIVDGVWELAGVIVVGPFTGGNLRGGFRGTVTPLAEGVVHITWAMDGVPTS